jgi:hypothetical protein
VGVAVVEVTVNKDVAVPPAFRLTEFGLIVTASPEDTDGESEIVPVKLFRLVRVTFEVPEAASGIVILEGIAAKKKSDTEGPVTVTVVVSVFVSFPS